MTLLKQAHEQFVTQTIIPSSPELIFATLANYEEHKKLHPYVVSITPIEQMKNGSKRFLTKERVPFAKFFHATHKLYVELCIHVPGKQLSYSVKVWPQITIATTYIIEPEKTPHKTLLQEQVNIEAPKIFMLYICRNAKIAHRRIFEKLLQNNQ